MRCTVDTVTAAMLVLLAIMSPPATGTVRAASLPRVRPAQVNPCPEGPTMSAACGNARKAGLGECLACLLQKFPTCHNSTNEDAFCLAGNKPKPNATVTWVKRIGNELDGSPAVSPDGTVVYVGSDDHYLYALDSRTGNTLWR
jgi:hypothetical protein